MSMSEENSMGHPNVEGESDENDKRDKGSGIPLVPPDRNRVKPVRDLGVGFDLDFDGWMKQYMLWTDKRPLYSRCVTSAITASLGVLLAGATSSNGKRKRSFPGQNRNRGTENEGIDLLEAISFAIHGGLVAGPLSYYIGEYLKQRRGKRTDTLSIPKKSSSSTYDLLIDQVVLAPPKLYLTFLVVDVTKTLLKTALPDASRKSVAILASALSDSLRFWPLSIYVLLKLLKKRRHYTAAINLFSIAFSMHLAKKRNDIQN